ncbi:LacI family DNA-binding transcriptional regulator [Streptomyces rubrogriseus]|uniref:LacI family DNA-binding transcriptional regulator n=1 Tax=Streptomyces rubrogriseus TaxID=194673 RepID=UPI0036F93F36
MSTSPSTADDGPSNARNAPHADASPKPARRATIRDVAAAAGVSTATVSKVFRGGYRLRPETEQRVRDAAEALNFSPNPYAQTLHGARTGTVGLITSDIEGRFSLPVMMGAEDAFGSDQVSVFLCDARGDAIREQHHLRSLLGRRVDGIIVVGSMTNPRETLGRDIPVPVVYAYAPSTHPDDVSVITDNVGAGRIAAEHLLSLGYSRIGYLSGDHTYLAARERVQGARSALQAAGTDILGGEALYGPWGEEWGRAGARRMTEMYPDMDALLCGSDHVARGALDALREDGVRVPEDLAVIGHDNWELLARQSRPPLSTIDNNLEALGRRAAELLNAAIDGSPQPGVHEVPALLVPRGSTLRAH